MIQVDSMVDKDENFKIQKITRLLERGGTMLASHHDCGAPMFRYQGKIMCPVCEGEQVKPEIKPGPETKPEIRIDTKSGLNKEWKSGNISHLVKNKIQEISESLEKETDLQRLKDKLECIELGAKILKSLED